MTTTMGPGIPVDPNRTRNLARRGRRTPEHGARTAGVRGSARLRCPPSAVVTGPRTLRPQPQTVGRHLAGWSKVPRTRAARAGDASRRRPPGRHAPCALRRGVRRLGRPRRSHAATGTDPEGGRHGEARQGDRRRRARRTSFRSSSRRRAHRVPRPDRGRSSRSCAARSARHVTYAVVKNTLTKIAAREAGVAGLDDLLAGPSAIAFVSGDPVEAAKGLRDFARANPLLVIKGGVLDGRALSAGRDPQARGPRVPRGAAGQAGRRDEGVAVQRGLALRGTAVADRPPGRGPAAEGRAGPVGPRGGAGTPAAAAEAVRGPRSPRSARRTAERRRATAEQPTPRPSDRADAEPPSDRRGRDTVEPAAETTEADARGTTTQPPGQPAERHGRTATMAKLSTDDLLDAFKEMTLHRALRVREAVRGHLRRHRRRPGRRRRRRAGRPAAAPPPRPRRSRTSSTSSSRPPATRRSRSSRRCAR